MRVEFPTLPELADASECVRAFRAIFPAPGGYTVTPDDDVLAKAAGVDGGEGPFETWFLQELERRANEHFESAELTLWETLDGLLARHRVLVPSELEAWTLHQALFDVSVGSTAEMCGVRAPVEVVARLTKLGWRPREILDFPALAYRMGSIYDALTDPTGIARPMPWAKVVALAHAHPLTAAEQFAVGHARSRAGIWLTPIVDDAGRAWTADREINPLRRLTARVIEDRQHLGAAMTRLRNSQRAVGVIRDARRVIRTEIAEARSRGVWAADASQHNIPTDARMIRMVSSNPCRSCAELFLNPDGTPRAYLRADIERADALGVNRGPRAEWHVRVAGVHPNCWPADALVASPGTVAGAERLYRGQLVGVVLDGGEHLAVTANHPILTTRGWRAAALLDVGDYLVSGRLRANLGGAKEHNEHVPSRIQDVVRSLGPARGMVASQVPTSRPDFHGDGEGSQVATIWADGVLGDGTHPACEEQLVQQSFVRAIEVAARLLRERGARPLGEVALASANRIMGGGGPGAALLLRQVARAQALGIAAGAQLLAVFAQHAGNRRSAHAMLRGEGEDGMAAVAANYRAFIEALGGALSLVPQADALGREIGAEYVTRHPMAALQDTQAVTTAILRGDIGAIQLRRVRAVRLSSFAGHVYNLTTVGHYYLASGATSNSGVITKNCVCSPWREFRPALRQLYESHADDNRAMLTRIRAFAEAA